MAETDVIETESNGVRPPPLRVRALLADAVAYPRRGDGWLKTIAIGGVLLLIPFGPIFVYGYLVRVIREGAHGNRIPPRFDTWGGLFFDGLKSLVIILVYPLIVFLVSVLPLSFLVGVLAVTGIVSDAFTFGTYVGYAVGLLAWYVGMAALANFAVEGSLRDAFDFKTVIGTVFTKEYLKAFSVGALVFAVLGTIGFVLLLLLVGFFILFYAEVVWAYAIGRGFGTARDLRPEVAPEPEPVPTD